MGLTLSTIAAVVVRCGASLLAPPAAPPPEASWRARSAPTGAHPPGAPSRSTPVSVPRTRGRGSGKGIGGNQPTAVAERVETRRGDRGGFVNRREAGEKSQPQRPSPLEGAGGVDGGGLRPRWEEDRGGDTAEAFLAPRGDWRRHSAFDSWVSGEGGRSSLRSSFRTRVVTSCPNLPEASRPPKHAPWPDDDDPTSLGYPGGPHPVPAGPYPRAVPLFAAVGWNAPVQTNAWD